MGACDLRPIGWDFENGGLARRPTLPIQAMYLEERSVIFCP